jgi:hypothetical protein
VTYVPSAIVVVAGPPGSLRYTAQMAITLTSLTPIR